MSLGLTLALDGSTYAGSVALIREHDVIAERQLPPVAKPGREGRAEQFMPMVYDERPCPFSLLPRPTPWWAIKPFNRTRLDRSKDDQQQLQPDPPEGA